MVRERAHITSSRYGGVGGPDTNDDFDDALRGGWGGNHQNDDVIYERLPGSTSIICVVDQWVDNELNE